jgi:hypothetical protein
MLSCATLAFFLYSENSYPSSIPENVISRIYENTRKQLERNFERSGKHDFINLLSSRFRNSRLYIASYSLDEYFSRKHSNVRIVAIVYRTLTAGFDVRGVLLSRNAIFRFVCTFDIVTNRNYVIYCNLNQSGFILIFDLLCNAL